MSTQFVVEIIIIITTLIASTVKQNRKYVLSGNCDSALEDSKDDKVAIEPLHLNLLCLIKLLL